LDTNFDFIAGSLCLDFCNTAEPAVHGGPEEPFVVYEDLLIWGRLAGTLGDAHADALARFARQEPGQAGKVLKRARALRLALQGVFFAAARNREVPRPDLDLLNREISLALPNMRIQNGSGSFRWAWSGDASSIDQPLWAVVRSAGEMLTSEHIVRVGQCHGDACAYLFLDSTKNRSRQWCDTRVCGNRSRVSRYRERRS